MADEQSLIAYTVPALSYVDPAHILLLGTSGGAGVNVLAGALVARQADGIFYADGNVAGNHTLAVRNYATAGPAASGLVLQTGGAGSYAAYSVVNGAYRIVTNGSAITSAYDDADTHYFRKQDGTEKLVLQNDNNALFCPTVWLNNYKLLFQHDGSHGYIRAETGNLYLGTASVNRWVITSAGFAPTTDNAYSICGAGNRATVVYASTGTINTSDEREKDWRGALNDAELRAARRIAGEIGVYRWLDAVAAKGDNARLHIGARAQRVWAIMAEEGLVDPIGANGRPGETPYAFLCWDEWEDVLEDEYETVTTREKVPATEVVSTVIMGTDGQPLRAAKMEERERIERRPTGNKVLVTPAGNRFGLRVDQLCLFLAAAQEQRLAALEAA